jgi:hypothetical protein
MGRPGDDHFFGKSLFEQTPGERRAFISTYQELGYLKSGKLVVLSPKKRVATYTVTADGSTVLASPEARLSDEAVAYYQSAFQAFTSGALKASTIDTPTRRP